MNYNLFSTFFTFNSKIYKQIFGTPMGSPLSLIIADVLQDLEKKALNKINVNILFYYRYVDDVILAAPSDQTSMFMIFSIVFIIHCNLP